MEHNITTTWVQGVAHHSKLKLIKVCETFIMYEPLNI